MDIATILGISIGTVFIFLAIIAGSPFTDFLNISGMVLVIGGTFAAGLVKFRISEYFVGIRTGLLDAFFGQNDNPRDIIAQTNRCARIARRNGLLGLEDEPISNPFFAKGVQMLVDGSALEFIQEVLAKEITQSIHRKRLGEKVFRAFGDSAPAFGMIGTLIGLVQMLNNLDDPTKLGPGMALALLTTFYGSVLAQLVFMPMAEKLDIKTVEQETNMELIIDAVVGIYNGVNPQVLNELLETYLPEYERNTISLNEEIE